jgi:hypothetical protein
MITATEIGTLTVFHWVTKYDLRRDRAISYRAAIQTIRGCTRESAQAIVNTMCSATSSEERATMEFQFALDPITLQYSTADR